LRRVVETHLRHHPDEKLLIFTEFKDTLTALERRFREWGFPCAVIHGQMNMAARVDEERRFRDEVQVMIGTDAAGEGINLQFCRLMVNYDLPWNPNRLEQRMGRIHRYGQTRDCFVFNMLYPETREGRVLARLMEKLERMRQRLGDTIYDVIGTLLEGVRLEDLIMQAVVAGEEAEPEQVLDSIQVEERLEAFRRALEENALAGHHIDLSAVQRDQADSLLRRLVPWDVERFTRLAVRTVGGQFAEDRQSPGVFRLSVPREFLKARGLQGDAFARGLRVAFERETARRAGAEFFAPGHPLLEALIDHCLQKDRPARTVLVDEKGRRGTLWLYRLRLQDGRDQPALERLMALFHDFATGETREVDPRVLWELEPPPEDLSLPDDLPVLLEAAGRAARQRALEHLDALQQEARAPSGAGVRHQGALAPGLLRRTHPGIPGQTLRLPPPPGRRGGDGRRHPAGGGKPEGPASGAEGAPGRTGERAAGGRPGAGTGGGGPHPAEAPGVGSPRRGGRGPMAGGGGGDASGDRIRTEPGLEPRGRESGLPGVRHPVHLARRDPVH
jgi:hypothetical protein